MKNMGSAAAVAAAFMVIAPAAFACEQWSLNGEKTILQSNDIAVVVKLEQDGAALKGEAFYTARSLPGRKGDWPVTGMLSGAVEADVVKFRVSWSADYYTDGGLGIGSRASWRSTGIYEGSIASDGAVAGESFDMKEASKKYGWRMLESAQCAVAAAPPPEAVAPGMENDTDRAGSDYRSFFLGENKPGLCQDACLKENNRCRAWTYVRPGVQGEKPVCYLKDRVPSTSANACCISGVAPDKADAFREPGGFAPETDRAAGAAAESGGLAGAVEPGMENNTDRPGNDYNRFVLTVPSPKNCKAACDADQGCAAWTYVRPGIQQKEAVCYVKRPAPAPVSNKCCISGKKALNPAAVREPQ
ncbi:MAG: PAN domain-containing protein [Parvularculaceae bacterium]